MLSNELLEKLTDFVLENSHYMSREGIKEAIIKHNRVNTCSYLEKDGKIIAVARWNVFGVTAHILDVIIDKEYRGKKLFPALLAVSWGRFPYVKYISFERERKYPDREERVYKITEFLRRI